MKGKHMKDTKNNKKKRRFKIVDKRKFTRSIIFVILLILIIILLGVRIFSNNAVNKVPEPTNSIISTDTDVNNVSNDNEINNGITNKITNVTTRGTTNIRTEQKYISLSSPETLYVNSKNGVNVRELYTTESEKVKTLQYGTEVKVSAKVDNWGLIDEGQWICMDYLSENKPIIETKKDDSEWIKFTATGYCPCSKCCGKNTGMTASGKKATANRTVAMSSKYSFGTKIKIKGMGTYIVEDRGGAIKGNRIDIYFNTHQEALNFGKKTVYIKIIK